MDATNGRDATGIATDWNTTDEHEIAVPLNTVRAALILVVGLTLLLAFTAYFGYAAVTTHSAPKRALAVVVALFFAIFAGFVIVGGKASMSPRSLTTGPDGIRYTSARRPWQLRWSELTQISIQQGYTVADRFAPGPRRIRRIYLVRLVMNTVPGTDGGRMLKRFHGRFGAAPDGYGFPLGPHRDIVPALDAALREHGGSRYTGIADIGDMHGQIV